MPHHLRGNLCTYNLWTGFKPVFQIPQILGPTLLSSELALLLFLPNYFMYLYLVSYLPGAPWTGLLLFLHLVYFVYFLENCFLPSLPNSLTTLTPNLNADLPLCLHHSPIPTVLQPKCFGIDRCVFPSDLGHVLHLAVSWWRFLWYLLQVPRDTGYDSSISCMPDTMLSTSPCLSLTTTLKKQSLLSLFKRETLDCVLALVLLWCGNSGFCSISPKNIDFFSSRQ